MSTGVTSTPSDFYWYHCIDLGDGVVTDGHYDMTPLLPHYCFPESMIGMRVLDVGRASGYFSFEMERRGAHVTATELPGILDWDFFGSERTKKEYLTLHPDIDSYSRRVIWGGFEYAHERLRSKVKPVWASVYDLSPERFDQQKFDLVFMGSISSHVRDPYRAFERIASVTAGTAIFACPILDISAVQDIPCMALNSSMKMKCKERLSWWTFNELALDTLLEGAGFIERKVMGRFMLPNRSTNEQYPHIVIHAKV